VSVAPVDAAAEIFTVAPLVGALLAVAVPAGASPIALGVAVAGFSRRLIAAANPAEALLPAASATGAAAPSLGSGAGAVESTAEAAIMGRQSVREERRLLRQNIRPAQATAAPIAEKSINN